MYQNEGDLTVRMLFLLWKFGAIPALKQCSFPRKYRRVPVFIAFIFIWITGYLSRCGKKQILKRSTHCSGNGDMEAKSLDSARLGDTPYRLVIRPSLPPVAATAHILQTCKLRRKAKVLTQTKYKIRGRA